MQEQFHGGGSEHLISPRHAESLSACATLGVQLLRANQAPLDPDSLRSFYRACAVEQGWIDAHGRIRTQAIRNAAIDIGARMPNDGEFAFMRDEQWIFKLLHRHRGSMHSLKHLTMLAMLDSDWPSLLSYYRPTTRWPS
ncbi:MAG: TnsD family Tn7-like transposition protein [Telluria sp.]